MLHSFTGTDKERELHIKQLKSVGIYEVPKTNGTVGVTLIPSESKYPPVKASLSGTIEIYLNSLNTTIEDLIPTIAHEMYGHALFQIKGMDYRHSAGTESLINNIPLENHINRVTNEAKSNNR